MGRLHRKRTENVAFSTIPCSARESQLKGSALPSASSPTTEIRFIAIGEISSLMCRTHLERSSKKSSTQTVALACVVLRKVKTRSSGFEVQSPVKNQTLEPQLFCPSRYLRARSAFAYGAGEF